MLKLALTVAIAGVALLCSSAAQGRGLAGPWNAGFSVIGAGTISGANGISCRESGGNCVAQFADGAVATLTATANAGASFSGWFGDCSGSGTTCTLTMHSHKTVAAMFTAGGSGAQAGLSMFVSGPGTVTGSGINCGNGNTDCSELYPVGKVVTLTATPAAGKTFSGWGGNCSGSGTTCTLTMDTAKSVTAIFSSGTTSPATLTVTVTGSGHVAGAGINCGQGNTDCSEVYTGNTTVTLAEVPASGATFAGWGGSCSGTASTCTVVMNASKSLTATFTQGSTTQRKLNVAVGGSGHVSGPGISCGASTRNDCSNAFDDGATAVLRATPAAGATFLGWGGACSGTQATCTVLMNAPRAVSASFSRGGGSSGAFSPRSLGRPIVVRTAVGWAVTLRFFTNRGVSALLRMSLNGRLVTAFRFSPHSGNVQVGPFNLGRNGKYRFRLTLSDASGSRRDLVWDSCLRCGGAFRPASSFLRREGATVSRSGAGWLVKVRFHASAPGTGTMRMTRNGRQVSAGNFSFNKGEVVVSLPVRERGRFRIVLTARNAAGRTTKLDWNAQTF